MVVLCEFLAREGGDADFACLFEQDRGDDIYGVIEALDHGVPLDREVPCASLWCALKSFVDCWPQPLLTFQGFEELKRRGIASGDRLAMKSFVVELFRTVVPQEHGDAALYLATFLQQACTTASARDAEVRDQLCAARKIQKMVRASFLLKRRGPQASADKGHGPPARGRLLSRERDRPDAPPVPTLTPALAAKVFAPGFLRPRTLAADLGESMQAAAECLEVFIASADEAIFWCGRPMAGESPDSSDSEEDGAALAEASRAPANTDKQAASGREPAR
mmetsp:Transcript_11133/g.31764  ORF Transcript_11133/g.31764 Transcript_11133/m.31764 type:complete len:278 (+) Transcript_11133:270-1103(+)